MNINKQKILDNVEEYQVKTLVKFILDGIVTYDELVRDTQGQFDADKRKKVKHLLESGDSYEWNKPKQERTIDAIQLYLDTFVDGEHRAEARNLKEKLLNEHISAEKSSAVTSEWNTVDKSSIDALRTFVNKYPESNYNNEANNLINKLLLDEIMDLSADTLVSQIRQYQTSNLDASTEDYYVINAIESYLTDEKISKNDFLDKLKEDTNLLSAGVIKSLLNNGVITFEDLFGIGIDKLFIRKMYSGESVQTFATPEKLDRIHKQSTEVYFWGIPSSGKSCAIGAILSAAASGIVSKAIDPDTQSQGYGYMTKLINLFQNKKIATLMEGTSIDSFYEMGFDLIDKQDKIHPITFIDMAGELMRCMYKENAGDTLEIEQVEMLETLTNVLIDNRSTSRKIHIFVIEYGAEDRLYEGLPQRVYLEGAVSYIKNTGIFKKDTDGIFLMISKADKAKDNSKEALTQYINDNYLGFYNGLEKICKDNEINKGKVEKIAFTLGKVCFQNYCRFDSCAAENVVNIILQRSASFRGGKIGKLQNILKN